MADTTDEVPAGDAAASTGVARAELTLAQCAAQLAERFPALFGPRPLPIKLRIQADIQQRAPGVFSKRILSIFLHRHTTSTAYIRALAGSTQRFDLDGQPAGEVAAEHLQAAQAELERRRVIVEARRQAEREATRQARRASAADVAAPVAAPIAAPDPAAGAAAPPRSQRAARPARPDRPAPPNGPRRAARPRHPDLPDRGPAAPGPDRRPPRREPPAQPLPALPEDAGRRERALLLRAWQGTRLSKANFCALKGLKEAEFDALIAQAQAEGAARG